MSRLTSHEAEERMRDVMALIRLDRIDEAEANLVALMRDQPDYAPHWVVHGTIMSKRYRYPEAEACYRRAIELDPGLFVAHHALATILDVTGAFQAAVAAYDRALELEPRSASLNASYGALLSRLGKIGEAARRLEVALEVDPDHPSALNGLGRLLVNIGEIGRGIALLTRAVAIDPNHFGYTSNLLLTLNYDPDRSVDEIAEAHFSWGKAQVGRVAESVVPSNSPDRDRKLRVGYLSPDFRNHAVGHAVEPVLAAHDRDHFEVTLYGEIERPDEVTERFKAAADRWRSTLGISDMQLVDQIRADGIDILVDLAGHTSGSRVTVLAHRAAPVQVNWHGYPNTTGLSTVDYRMVDAITDPPGQADRLTTETLIRLPTSFVVDVVDPDTPPIVIPPVFRNGFATFGSFNNFAKVNARVVALWARILHAVPDSKLLLKSSSNSDEFVHDRYRTAFAAEGIAAERLEFRERAISTADHLAAYGNIDIALDTFPYNGTSTTMEALRMGVPVITLAGQSHVARVGASFLTWIQHPEWIAADSDSYVAKAAELAADRSKLAALRMRLRRDYQDSPVANPTRLARAIEAAYREMWRTWCAQSSVS